MYITPDRFVTTKRTSDGGVDGRLYFGLPGKVHLESMTIEVKGGKNVSIESLRALRGVLDDDEAVMAGLITMEPLGPTKERNFRRFMADAGDLEVLGTQYPRMQLLTVQEILDGKRFNTPGVAGRGLAQPKVPGIGKRWGLTNSDPDWGNSQVHNCQLRWNLCRYPTKRVPAPEKE